jgi:hypothetical protein
VLTCEINPNQLRRRFEPKRVLHRNRVVAIKGVVPVTVVRSHPTVDSPTTPSQLAAWMNKLLRLRPYKGVSRSHPGIQRLSRWVGRRVAHAEHPKITAAELVALGRQWLPEYFDGVEVDLQRLHAMRRMTTIEVAADAEQSDVSADEALDLLNSAEAKKRVRGLQLLAEIGDPDLLDWCSMFLEGESVLVRLAALETTPQFEDADPEIVQPLAESRNKGTPH